MLVDLIKRGENDDDFAKKDNGDELRKLTEKEIIYLSKLDDQLLLEYDDKTGIVEFVFLFSKRTRSSTIS